MNPIENFATKIFNNSFKKKKEKKKAWSFIGS